jgi:penicillin V acylase-like amidase (Ntn superfamily)
MISGITAGSDGNFTHVLRDNPLQVMTNQPQLPQHYAQYER